MFQISEFFRFHNIFIDFTVDTRSKVFQNFKLFGCHADAQNFEILNDHL